LNGCVMLVTTPLSNRPNAASETPPSGGAAQSLRETA